jgi:hypothetical protein
MKKASNVMGGIGKAALPMAANFIAPGLGSAVAGGIQQGIGSFNPQDERITNAQKQASIVPSVNTQQGLPINYELGGALHKYDGGGFTTEQPSMMVPGQKDLTSWYNPYGPENDPNASTNVAKTTTPVPTATGNYDINTGLTSTQQDLSVKETPLSALANVAGIGYNAYQAIKKPQKMTPGDFYVGAEAIRPDYTEAENEARNSYAALMNGLKQSGLSGGAMASNLQAGALERNRAMAQIATAEENAYRADQQHVRDANTQNMIQAKSAALQANWAIQAARQEHAKEAITGVRENEDRKTANKLAINYAVLGAPDISRFKNVGYNTVNNRAGDWWLNQRNKNKGTTK